MATARLETEAIAYYRIKGMIMGESSWWFSTKQFVEDVEAAITKETVLISIMAANNEIGTVQPISEIGRLVRSLRKTGRKIWFHTDAVQAAGKLPLDVEEIGCDLLSLSAHKIYAPKGAGALYVRRGVRLHPQNIGGHQERELRGGTEAVPNIVAFGVASEIAVAEMATSFEKIKNIRDNFEGRIGEASALGKRRHGAGEQRQRRSDTDRVH